MKAYLSAPMTGVPDLNFPLLDEVAAAWRAIGNEGVSPAEQDRELAGRGEDPTYEEFLALDFVILCRDCDAIVMLPGWEKSIGAKAERYVAEMTGKTVYLAYLHGDTHRPEDDGWRFIKDFEQKRMYLDVKTLVSRRPAGA